MTLHEVRVHDLRPGDEWFQDNGWATVTKVTYRGGPTDRVDVDFDWDGDPIGEDNPWGGDIAIVKRPDPELLPGEVFGFWHHGVWQPVLEGVTVTALPDGAVRFTYPKPDLFGPHLDPETELTLAHSEFIEDLWQGDTEPERSPDGLAELHRIRHTAQFYVDSHTPTANPGPPRQPQTLLVGVNEDDCARYHRDHHVTLGPRRDICAIWPANHTPADGHTFTRVIYTHGFRHSTGIPTIPTINYAEAHTLDGLRAELHDLQAARDNDALDTNQEMRLTELLDLIDTAATGTPTGTPGAH